MQHQEGGPLQAGAVLCRLKSAANKNVTGLIKFSGKAAKLQAARRACLCVSFCCLGGQHSDVEGDNSLAFDWSPGSHTASTLVELFNPDTGYGLPMFQCFGKV